MRIDVFSCVIGGLFIVAGFIAILFRAQLVRSISAEQRARFGQIGERVASKGRPVIFIGVGIASLIFGCFLLTLAIIR
jgi:hypothetical protein